MAPSCTTQDEWFVFVRIRTHYATEFCARSRTGGYMCFNVPHDHPVLNELLQYAEDETPLSLTLTAISKSLEGGENGTTC